MMFFKKNKVKGKPGSDVPGYGGKWFLSKEDSPKVYPKKKRPSEKLPNYPVDIGFVYYDDE